MSDIPMEKVGGGKYVQFSNSTLSVLPKNGNASDSDIDGATGQANGNGAALPPRITKNEKRKIWLWISLSIAVLAIAGIVIGVLFAKGAITTNGSSSGTMAADGSSTAGNEPAGSPTNNFGTATSNTTEVDQIPATACTKAEDIPQELRGTSLDPTTWLTLDGFNCTFTSQTVGDLPLVGLNRTWSDSARANEKAPALNEPWGDYKKHPIRGVNLGGWLSLEPFITPSLFNYPKDLKIIDEYTLVSHLGPKEAAKVLEKHYATFITEEDFKNIAAAGLDHIRIPFSYWAVSTFDTDPYVPKISWRYLLRGIEWARKYGLRVKLDVHALAGSQNGWNHSGRSGKVNWILGTDTDGNPKNVNRKRSLELHDKLSKFFAEERYQNVIAFYGLANEPTKEISMAELVSWTEEVFALVKKNGIKAPKVFSESMKGLEPWTGQMQGHGNELIIDVHEYLIFDPYLVKQTHKEKVEYACDHWGKEVSAGNFGPTMVGEFSQADTDCTLHVNGVFNGARWNGTFFDVGPSCASQDEKCDCSHDMADPSTYSKEYKLFLQTFAEAQMSAFEKSWGYFYWTWKTESAPQWSYEAAWQGGFMPKLAYERSYSCGNPVPSFGSLPEYY